MSFNNSSPKIRVESEMFKYPEQDYTFLQDFRIGRRDDAEVCIKDEFVSRYHAEVVFDNGKWWVRDLGSSNGIFVDGVRVQSKQIEDTLSVRLGVEGPFVTLILQLPIPASAIPAARPLEVADAIDRYFDSGNNQPVGEHTMIVRKAFEQVQKKQKRRYGGVFALLGLCLCGLAGYTWYLHKEFAQRTNTALELFYSMKELDLQIASVEKLVSDAGSQRGAEAIQTFRERRKGMEKNYDNFLNTLHVYDAKLSPQQRLILRIARIFGESELALPPDFMAEIEEYISKWKSSNRLAKALKTAQDNGYIPVIARELLAQDLPPQFLYMALQESNFDAYISGPPTRSGIAKGMWQFVPETALKYGLRLGPLVDLPRPDPADDRHHWDRATKAAVSYLKDLYRTDAQASGFLVMSCYNWGEDSVIPLIRKMPANPKDRNFWRLLAQGKEHIPKETYDYVFYIASAAVIGENPRLFGFDFDGPLAFLENR